MDLFSWHQPQKSWEECRLCLLVVSFVRKKHPYITPLEVGRAVANTKFESPVKRLINHYLLSLKDETEEVWEWAAHWHTHIYSLLDWFERYRLVYCDGLMVDYHYQPVFDSLLDLFPKGIVLIIRGYLVEGYVGWLTRHGVYVSIPRYHLKFEIWDPKDYKWNQMGGLVDRLFNVSVSGGISYCYYGGDCRVAGFEELCKICGEINLKDCWIFGWDVMHWDEEMHSGTKMELEVWQSVFEIKRLHWGFDCFDC